VSHSTLGLGFTVRFILRLGIWLWIRLAVGLGIWLGAGLIIEFASVRDGLIIALTAVVRTFIDHILSTGPQKHSAHFGPNFTRWWSAFFFRGRVYLAIKKQNEIHKHDSFRSAIWFSSVIIIPIPNPSRSEPNNFSFNSLLSFRSPIWTYNYPHKRRIQRFNDQRCLLFSLQSPTTILSLVNKTERKTLLSTTICLQISLLISDNLLFFATNHDNK